MSKLIKFLIILIICIFGLGISENLLAQNANEECDLDKIGEECYELEAKNREAYEKCEKIKEEMPGVWDWDDNWPEEKKEETKREIKRILDKIKEVDKEYDKCNKDRLNTWGPLIIDCWKRYWECFDKQKVSPDEDIQPEDLDLPEPWPGVDYAERNFIYRKFTNWVKEIQSFFTFDPVKKAELRMKFANEKLMELKKIVQKTDDPKIIKKATENYQQEVERVKNQVEKIKQKSAENPRVESFLDKFIHQQTLHQKLLQKLETQVPAEAFEKIEEARETHLENFQGVMLKLEDRKEKITEKLDKILEEQKGSQFKEFKNLEVLKDLEEKVPEEAKEAIQKAQENALKRLQGDLEKMTPEDQEKFKDYIERISGEKEKQLEIMENLKAKIKEVPPTPAVPVPLLLEKLEAGKAKIFEKIEERLEKLDCPLWILPAPGFCEEGRVIIEKDPETGCPQAPRCIIPGETEIPAKPLPVQPEKPEAVEVVCITLWDPVCGKDGKTYSNSCFAKSAGMEIEYKGVCREGIKPVPPAFPEQPSEIKEGEMRGVDVEKVK